MREYHKIQSIFLRDPETKHKNFLMWQYTLPEFELLQNCEWTATEKIDGTNIRVFYDGETDTITFGGRTENAQIPAFLFKRLQELFPNTDKFKEVFEGKNVCFYGEGYGNRIQKIGKHYISEGVDFILFDITVNDVWLDKSSVDDLAYNFGLKSVPIIFDFITLPEAVEFVSLGKMKSAVSESEMIAEGLILTPRVQLLTKTGKRIITKIKVKDFKEPVNLARSFGA